MKENATKIDIKRVQQTKKSWVLHFEALDHKLP
jgi:hypothetical protein